MKKINLLVALLLLVSVAMGQKPGKGMDRSKVHMQLLDSVVGLTDAQRSQVQLIHDTYHDSMMNYRQAHNFDEMKRLRTTIHDEINAVLTADQQAKLAEFRKTQREKMDAMHKEIMALHEQKVVPVMKTFRIEFDEQLNDQEKSTIHNAREQMKVLKAEMDLDTMMPMPGPKYAGYNHPIPDAIRNDLQVIIDSHDSTLSPILEQMRTLHRELEPEVKAIKQKYMTDGHPGMHMKGPGKEMRKEGMKNGKGKPGQGPGMSGQWMAYYFLLMES